MKGWESSATNEREQKYMGKEKRERFGPRIRVKIKTEKEGVCPNLRKHTVNQAEGSDNNRVSTL